MQLPRSPAPRSKAQPAPHGAPAAAHVHCRQLPRSPAPKEQGAALPPRSTSGCTCALQAAAAQPCPQQQGAAAPKEHQWLQMCIAGSCRAALPPAARRSRPQGAPVAADVHCRQLRARPLPPGAGNGRRSRHAGGCLCPKQMHLQVQQLTSGQRGRAAGEARSAAQAAGAAAWRVWGSRASACRGQARGGGVVSGRAALHVRPPRRAPACLRRAGHGGQRQPAARRRPGWRAGPPGQARVLGHAPPAAAGRLPKHPCSGSKSGPCATGPYSSSRSVPCTTGRGPCALSGVAAGGRGTAHLLDAWSAR